MMIDDEMFIMHCLKSLLYKGIYSICQTKNVRSKVNFVTLSCGVSKNNF